LITIGLGAFAVDATPATAKAPKPMVINPDQPYFEFQVEKQVQSAPDSPHPTYPAALKAAKIEGEVLAQYVVNTDGRADVSTFKVLKSTRPEFVDAVKEALPQMRFIPAEIGGHKVKQMVQQPYTFAISRSETAGPITIPNPTPSKKK